MGLLQNKVGLITGAGGGIGRGVARRFAREGATVVIAEIDPKTGTAVAAECKELGAESLFVKTDVTDKASLESAIHGAVERFGGLDILVNNAGIAGPTGAVEDLDPDQWDRTVSTNLNSQFYFLRKAVPLLKETSDAPGIIAMASVAGRLGYPFRTPYAATKWAIVGLVKSLAVELGPSNIRVNAILPGAVEGERMDRVIAARADALGIGFEQMKTEYLGKISLRRMVTVDDIAAMTLFLASPAGRNISGQAISIDGNTEYL